MNLQALAFVAGLVTVLLIFICFVYRVSKRYSGRISQREYSHRESIVIAGIVLGVVGMFQPWTPVF